MTWPSTVTAFGRAWRLGWQAADRAQYETEPGEPLAVITVAHYDDNYFAALGGEDACGLDVALRELEDTVRRVCP
jgi:hypothetical protein